MIESPVEFNRQLDDIINQIKTGNVKLTGV